MGIDDLILPNRDLIQRIVARHGAVNVRVFGSIARGEAGPQNDIDLLVEAGPATSAWFPGGLVADLEDLLGHRVDLIIERGLSPDVRDQVLAEAIPV